MSVVDVPSERCPIVANHIVKLIVPRTERLRCPARCFVAGETPLRSMKPAMRSRLMNERQKTISNVPASPEESLTKALMTAKKNAATSIQHD